MSCSISSSLVAAGRCAAMIVAASLLALPIEAAEPAATEQASVPPAPAGWKLAWNDEFAGEAIDESKWGFDVGNGFYNYDA